MANENLDRSNPTKFIHYMRENPYYFQSVFGEPFSLKAAKKALSSLRMVEFKGESASFVGHPIPPIKKKIILGPPLILIPLRSKIEKKKPEVVPTSDNCVPKLEGSSTLQKGGQTNGETFTGSNRSIDSKQTGSDQCGQRQQDGCQTAQSSNSSGSSEVEGTESQISGKIASASRSETGPVFGPALSFIGKF